MKVGGAGPHRAVTRQARLLSGLALRSRPSYLKPEWRLERGFQAVSLTRQEYFDPADLLLQF